MSTKILKNEKAIRKEQRWIIKTKESLKHFRNKINISDMTFNDKKIPSAALVCVAQWLSIVLTMFPSLSLSHSPFFFP